jgi:hypothetical protein
MNEVNAISSREKLYTYKKDTISLPQEKEVYYIKWWG